MFNYEVLNDDNKIGGTSLEAYCTVSYQKLVKEFGQPVCFDDYKTDAEWVVQDMDGRVFTVYNYKDGKNYCGEEGKLVEEIVEWHIGAVSQDGVSDLVDYLKEEMEGG